MRSDRPKLFIFGGGDKADLLNELHVFNVHTSRGRCCRRPAVAAGASRHTSRWEHAAHLGRIGGDGRPRPRHRRCTGRRPPSTATCPSRARPHVDGGRRPLGRALLLGGYNSRTAFDVHAPTSTPRVAAGGTATPVCGNRHAVAWSTRPRRRSRRASAPPTWATRSPRCTRYFREAGLGWAEVETAMALLSSRPALVMLSAQVWCSAGGGRRRSRRQLLDTRTMTWATPELEGLVPTARMGCTATPSAPTSSSSAAPTARPAARPPCGRVRHVASPHRSGGLPPARVGHTHHVSGQLYVLGGAARGRAQRSLRPRPGAESWRARRYDRARGVGRA